MGLDELQKWLDGMSKTILDGDFDRYQTGVGLPLTLETDEATTLYTTSSELRVQFKSWRNMLLTQGVTHMVRTAEKVVAVQPNIIEGRYQTELLREAVRVCPPYPSSMRLVRNNEAWQIVHLATGMANRSFPITVPRVPANPVGRIEEDAPHRCKRDDDAKD